MKVRVISTVKEFREYAKKKKKKWLSGILPTEKGGAKKTNQQATSRLQ